MNRGSVIDLRGHGALPEASMRPRFMNRGSHVLAGDESESDAASMRPRFMNRGSRHADVDVAPYHDGLQ